MPISDSRMTLEARHTYMLTNANVKKKSKEFLENAIKSETDWKRKNELECELLDLNDDKTDDTNIDYLLNVMPILKEYTENRVEENNSHELNGFVNVTGNQNRGKLYDKYLGIIENKSILPDSKCIYTCNACKQSRIMIESTMICPTCGDSEISFDMGSQNMSYDQEINSEINISFAYKRINHFNEWIAQFQAKESTEIHQSIIDDIRNEFKKARIINTKDITQKRVKDVLKKLQLNKYYEHVAHITNVLNGIKPISMSSIMEEELRSMFRDIQEPFEKHKPKNRSNFLSYGYCLYKFCQLLEYDEYLDCFPLLKSREKLYQQDCIFKKICNELNWEFIPTV